MVRWPCPRGFLSRILASLIIISFYSEFLRFFAIFGRRFPPIMGLPIRAGSPMDYRQSAFVLVKPRDPHFPVRTISVRHKWAWLPFLASGVCSSAMVFLRVFHLHTFPFLSGSLVPFAGPGLGFSGPALEMVDALSPSPRRSMSVSLIRHPASVPPAMVDVLRGLPGTITSQGEGFAALFRGLIDAG